MAKIETEVATGQPKKRTFKKFSFRGVDLDALLDMSTDELVKLFTARARRSLEFWYNTILVLLTGNMVNAEIAIDALSICLNIDGWEMMISFGFLAAASVRVLNELGGGSSKAAKFLILNIVLTSFTIGLVLFIFFLSFRGRLAYIFTESSEALSVEILAFLLNVKATSEGGNDFEINDSKRIVGHTVFASPKPAAGGDSNCNVMSRTAATPRSICAACFGLFAYAGYFVLTSAICVYVGILLKIMLLCL